jgi:hypothetical protein
MKRFGIVGNPVRLLAILVFAAGACACSLASSADRVAWPDAMSTMAPTVKVAGGVVVVVEYYNEGLNHYFISADPAEMAVLDGGAFGGAWKRTGESFPAWDIVGSPPGTVPVCRFFGTDKYRSNGTRIGANSHFYTADPAECEFVRTGWPSVASDGMSYPAWTFESYAFAVKLPVGGVCPDGTQPLYRTYNNGANNDPGHRYSMRASLLQGMAGWAFEGLVMCLPQGPPNWTGTSMGTFATPEIVETTTANVTWKLSTFVGNIAVYKPTGTVSATISFVGCSNGHLVPPSHAIDPSSDGLLTIDYNANPPSYHGTGLSSWSATLVCDEGSIPGYEGQNDYFGGSKGAGPLGVDAAGVVSPDGVTIQGSDSRNIGGFGTQSFQWKFTSTP